MATASIRRLSFLVLPATFHRRTIVSLGALALFLATAGFASSGDTDARLVLARFPGVTESPAAFTCDDTVHGELILPRRAVGFHTLEGVWMSPAGVEFKRATTALDFPPPGRNTAFLSLQITSEPGSTPALSGEWKLEVLWDGQPLAESRFNVKC